MMWHIFVLIIFLGNILPYILLFLGFVAAVCEVIDRSEI